MNKEIELCGYFDKNFGDDYMQKITAHYMPEYMFYVSSTEQASDILLKEENVMMKPEQELNSLPKLMVIGSGFMVNSYTALKCEIKQFLKNKHFADFCIGCNIEPFNNLLSKWLIIQKIKGFKFVVCRDKKSYLWLKANCQKLKIEYMPDILFAMPDKWLPSPKKRDKLGISLLHRSGDKEQDLYYRQMAEIADYWIENHKKDVILMAFDTGNEDDIFACNSVKKLMKHSSKAKIITHGNNAEIINAYAVCEKIIGARFHSAVLAIKMGVDFYPIIYRDKMRNLISDIEYPIKGNDITDIDIKSITRFLGSNIGYKFNTAYVRKAENSFKLLEKHIEELV